MQHMRRNAVIILNTYFEKKEIHLDFLFLYTRMPGGGNKTQALRMCLDNMTKAVQMNVECMDCLTGMEERVKNKVDFWAHLYKGS